MYHLATMHSIADRRKDRQTDHNMMPTADYTVCSMSG